MDGSRMHLAGDPGMERLEMRKMGQSQTPANGRAYKGTDELVATIVVLGNAVDYFPASGFSFAKSDRALVKSCVAAAKELTKPSASCQSCCWVMKRKIAPAVIVRPIIT